MSISCNSRNRVHVKRFNFLTVVLPRIIRADDTNKIRWNYALYIVLYLVIGGDHKKEHDPKWSSPRQPEYKSPILEYDLKCADSENIENFVSLSATDFRNLRDWADAVPE